MIVFSCVGVLSPLVKLFYAGDHMLLFCFERDDTLEVKVLLPKLHHSTGEVCCVCDAVVGVTLLCVPWIIARFPWQFLHERDAWEL